MKDLTYAPYFDNYLKLVKFENASRELEDSGKEIEQFFRDCPPDRWNYRYAKGKWNVKEVLLHIIQTEMIFNYRALTIASESKAPNLHGFDQDQYLKGLRLEDRVPHWLIAFFKATRQQTILFGQMLTAEQLAKKGIASDSEIQVEALFYITSGHTRHHLNVLRERYLT